MTFGMPAPGTTTTAHPTRLHALTGTRFLAALAVFLFHATLARLALSPYQGETALTVEHLLSKAGWVGVSYFFVLSGFVLAWSSRPGTSRRQFWWRRLLRVYPLHLASLLLALAGYAWASTTWRELIPNVLLVQSWIPRFETFFGINSPSWSLSCELFFYACFPLLHRLIGRIEPARLWYWVGGVVAVVICLPALAYALLPDAPGMPNGFPVSLGQYWLVYLFPPVRALEFVLGILLARIVRTGRWPGLRPLPILALTLACYVLALRVPFLYGLGAATIVPAMLLIPSVVDAELRGRARWLSSRPMVFLGEISFSFYLVHVPLLLVLPDLVGLQHTYSVLPATGVLLLLLTASLALAWLLHVTVERPLVRRWSGRTRILVPAPSIPRQAGAPGGVRTPAGSSVR